MTQKQSSHDDVVNKIRQNPGLIGLEGVILSCDAIVLGSNGVTGQVDGLFFTKHGTLYQMEYKSGDNPEKAHEKLKRMQPYVQRATGMRPFLLYVYKGKYDDLEVRYVMGK